MIKFSVSVLLEIAAITSLSIYVVQHTLSL